jgi:hypothetical protein
MPTITVSDESYVALQGLAEPLVDTPDTVIAKLLRAYRASAKTDDARRSPASEFCLASRLARLAVVKRRLVTSTVKPC